MIDSIRVPRRVAVLGAMAALGTRAAWSADGAVDALGRPVTLKRPADRIVLGFNYEEYAAVAGPAGWDRVVGLDRNQWAVNRAASWTRYVAAIPKLAGIADIGSVENGTFSVEAVFALKPDLLIMYAIGYLSRAQQMQQIEQAGIPILVIDYNSQILEKHVASTLAMGQATGNEDRARALADLYIAQTADIRRRVAGKPEPKVYVELGFGGASVIGNTYSNSMWGRMLGTAGAQNIADNHIAAAYAPLSAEYVLTAAPSHIFIAGSSWTNSPNAVRTGYDADLALTRRTLAPYAARPGWSTLPAIRDGELHAVEHGLSRSLWDWVGTQYLAKQLYPDAFADIDPEANLRQYHERFLPVKFEGCWMTRLTPRTA
jgi:iron complex transport system substrate-binding protein